MEPNRQPISKLADTGGICLFLLVPVKIREVLFESVKGALTDVDIKSITVAQVGKQTHV